MNNNMSMKEHICFYFVSIYFVYFYLMYFSWPVLISWGSWVGWLRLRSSNPHDLGLRPMRPHFSFLCFIFSHYSRLLPYLLSWSLFNKLRSWLSWLRLWLANPMTCVQPLPATLFSFLCFSPTFCFCFFFAIYFNRLSCHFYGFVAFISFWAL